MRCSVAAGIASDSVVLRRPICAPSAIDGGMQNAVDSYDRAASQGDRSSPGYLRAIAWIVASLQYE